MKEGLRERMVQNVKDKIGFCWRQIDLDKVEARRR